LSGSIPSQLGNLENLDYLSLQQNELTGYIPRTLGQLSKLEALFISQNQLTGPIPQELGDLSNLQFIGVQQNQLTGKIPPELGQLTKLQFVEFEQNQFTGSIPPEIGNLTDLLNLSLHDNQLTGQLPDLNALTKLWNLGLGGNDLELSWDTFASDGEFNLETRGKSLVSLYLHDSGLSGPIPNWLGEEHTDLVRLSLQNNTLTGTIPANFGNLKELGVLRLDGNQLTSRFGFLPKKTVVGFPATDASSSEGFSGWTRDTPFFVKLRLPSGADATRSMIVLPPHGYALEEGKKSLSALKSDGTSLPPHYRFAGIPGVIADSTIDMMLNLHDDQGEVVDAPLPEPAVVCVSIPSIHADKEVALLKYDGAWKYLDPVDPPAGYNPGADSIAVCGTTEFFSSFVPVVDQPSQLPGRALISRIEPSISSVTLSPGDDVTLSFDIYGRQDILDNGLGDGHVFEWDIGSAGGSFRSTARSNAVVYTAPDAPGTHALSVVSPAGACLASDDSADTEARCTAIFTITVRRPTTVSDERPAPQNPTGELPTVLVDAEGRQYAVFTPEQGGIFDGGEVSLSVDPGAVSNLEIVGLRVDASGPASNAGATAHRYTLSGDAYDVLVVDAAGSAISSYVLHSPAEVCVPLPAVARRNISDVALVARNADATLTILSAKVRITGSGVDVCGSLGSLPASVAVGVSGAPDALPTPVTDADEIAPPDTGGGVTAGNWLLPMFAIGVFAIAAGAWTLTRPRRRGAAKR
jgi:hypothetical protein